MSDQGYGGPDWTDPTAPTDTAPTDTTPTDPTPTLPPADVTIPDIMYNQDWLPDLTGDVQPQNSSGGSDNPPPSNPPYHVLPASIRFFEETAKPSLGDAIIGQDGWNELKVYVDQVKHWIFYRPEHASTDSSGLGPGYNPAYNIYYPTEDSRHAPPSQDALDAISLIDNLMAGGAGTLMAVGELLDRLNAAGQIYVAADQHSFFPSA